MNLKKWVIPASLYIVGFAIIFTVSLVHGLANDRQQLNQAHVSDVPAQAVNQTLPETTPVTTDTSEEVGTQPANLPSRNQELIKAQNQDQKGEARQTQTQQTQTQASDYKCPVQGEVLRPMGNYYSSTLQGYVYHAGVDYSEPEGVVIRAGHQGMVTFAGKDVLLGERVTLNCGDGWQVTYGGLEHLVVQEGQSVSPGQALGQVGFNPGNEGQGRPQLHYEVWHYGESVRP